MTSTSSSNAPRPGLPAVTAATRQRLQSMFDHAQRSVEKKDHDYANNLFSQCLIDDPGNLIYLQHFLGNLAQKYNNNKKGSKFSTLKLARPRMSLTKEVGKAQWREAFTSATEALSHNPWDVATLLAVADAYEQTRNDECLLYTLRWGLDASPKDIQVNRRAAQTLGRMGQFEQAISCWRRVLAAKPIDEEASKAISQLGVEHTIQKGGYQQELLHGALADPSKLEASVRGNPARANEEAPTAMTVPEKKEAFDRREKELRDLVDASPAEVKNYLDLAQLYFTEERFRDAQKLLSRALDATGGGDLNVRERFEEAHLRHAHQQVQIAQRRAEKDTSADAKELARRMAAQANQAEMEVYAARAAREPGNRLLQFELGLRCKKAGKYKEAIQAFQAASDDVRHKALVQLNLGESFQHIRQFRLALSSYEAAILAADSMQPDTRKLALYRAGVLAAELDENERAEKYLTELAAVDYGYRDVADRLDKLAKIRDSG